MTPEQQELKSSCKKLENIKTNFDSCAVPYQEVEIVMEQNNEPKDGIDNLKDRASEMCSDAIIITKQDKIMPESFLRIMPLENSVFTGKIIKYSYRQVLALIGVK
jgi:hypothetical protein